MLLAGALICCLTDRLEVLPVHTSSMEHHEAPGTHLLSGRNFGLDDFGLLALGIDSTPRYRQAYHEVAVPQLLLGLQADLRGGGVARE